MEEKEINESPAVAPASLPYLADCRSLISEQSILFRECHLLFLNRPSVLRLRRCYAALEDSSLHLRDDSDENNSNDETSCTSTIPRPDSLKQVLPVLKKKHVTIVT